MSRIVSQFSCGAASAIATKLTLVDHTKEEILIVNAFLHNEDPDNRRFLADCEKWFEHPVMTLRDVKYNADTHEVWKQKRYIKGPNGAPCSSELKRKLLASISKPGDVVVLGFTVEEEDRLWEMQQRFAGETFEAPLISRGLTKSDCLAMVERAGITLPNMYLRGYQNANCIGCPKGGQNYWQAIREDFPEQFIQIKEIQESIGPGASFLRFRSGPRKNERMSLAELPLGRGNMNEEPDFSCSFLCDIAEQDIAGSNR